MAWVANSRGQILEWLPDGRILRGSPGKPQFAIICNTTYMQCSIEIATADRPEHTGIARLLTNIVEGGLPMERERTLGTSSVPQFPACLSTNIELQRQLSKAHIGKGGWTIFG